MSNYHRMLKNRFQNNPEEYVQYVKRSVELSVSVDLEKVRHCVFQVPNTISDLKRESYVPQKIGLGPYHHFRQVVHDRMEGRKLAAISKLRSLIVDYDLLERLLLELQRSEPIVRGLYDSYKDEDNKYININGAMLKNVLATDILFLLDFLLVYPLDRITPPSEEFLEDIMMLENQIPFALLRPVANLLFRPSSDVPITERQLLFSHQIQSFLDGNSDDWLYSSIFKLCKKNFPFRLATRTPRFPLYSNSDHILDLMQKMFVDTYRKGTDGGGTPATENVPGVSVLDLPYPQHSPLELATVTGGGTAEVDELFLLMEKFVPCWAGLQLILKFLKFFKNVPWKGILVLCQCLFLSYKRNNNKRDPLVRKIKIPSASKLCRIGGIGFEATTLDNELIHFSREQFILRLTLIQLNTVSEVILRNLVAYEPLLPPQENLVSDYLDLMCGIIHTADDVRILRDKNIIEGDMSEGKILELFEGIGKTTGGKRTTNNSLWKTIVDINNHFDSRRRVRIERLMRKFGNSLYALGKWFIILLFALAILLLCFNRYCKVYGTLTFLGKYGIDL